MTYSDEVDFWFGLTLKMISGLCIFLTFKALTKKSLSKIGLTYRYSKKSTVKLDYKEHSSILTSPKLFVIN